jgi:hypothetical protein
VTHARSSIWGPCQTWALAKAPILAQWMRLFCALATRLAGRFAREIVRSFVRSGASHPEKRLLACPPILRWSYLDRLGHPRDSSPSGLPGLPRTTHCVGGRPITLACHREHPVQILPAQPTRLVLSRAPPAFALLRGPGEAQDHLRRLRHATGRWRRPFRGMSHVRRPMAHEQTHTQSPHPRQPQAQ